MTVKEIYEYVLIELNKVGASTVYLDDFNYYLNKAIREYVNKKYVLYDTTQQTTDDFKSLVKTIKYEVNTTIVGNSITYSDPTNYIERSGDTSVSGTAKTYTNLLLNEDGCVIDLPDNYFHTLSISTDMETLQTYKGKVAGSVYTLPTRRLTADNEVGVIGNAFLKPSFNRPYYFIKSMDDKPSVAVRVGNTLPYFAIKSIYLTYLRVPKKVILTSLERDTLGIGTTDLEFSDYVCNEIAKSIVVYLLENGSNQRLQTFSSVNPDFTTGMPTQAQTVK